MEESHQAQYAQPAYEGRSEARDRNAEQYHQHQHHQPVHAGPLQQQQNQQQQQQSFPPQSQQTPQQQHISPPPSASPFAFAPPPLSAHPHQGHSQNQGPSRPPLPLHHSEPPPQPQQYQQHYGPPKPPPQPQHHHSYPGYPGGGLGYRSFSGESSRQSPLQAHLPRPGAMPPSGSGPSPSMAPLPSPVDSGPYSYQRQPSYGGPANGQPSPHDPHQQSPQRPNLYAPSYYSSPYSQPPGQAPPPGPTAADMPRSLSYTAGTHHPHPYQPAYHPYVPMSGPMSVGGYHPGAPPPLNRNHTTSTLSNGLAGMDLSRHAPSLGYSFANRLPLVDRPFKCDECVQSFNRNHDLKRHKRIHLSVKPFGCDKCGKTFSRKDALRRHWLVKGCRGEEGATAPIVPLFPINAAAGLSPPSPPSSHSPVDNVPPHPFQSAHAGFNHPSAPPPLTSLPARQPSDQSMVIVTPEDPVSSGHAGVNPPLEEPLGIDPAYASMAPGAQRGSGSSGDGGEGYFEGVVGIKSDGTAVLDHKQNGPAESPYSRIATTGHPAHQAHFHHPYRRTSNISPHPAASPTAATHYSAARPYTPSALGPDGKPIFAVPFARQEYGQQQEGMLAPPFDGATKMEKQLSQMSQASVEAESFAPVQRWHRASFPFPPSNNVYNAPHFEASSPVDIAAPQQAVLASGYGQR